MRDRLVELLPLLLVTAILFAFYLARSQGPALQFVALSADTAAPSPVALAAPVSQAQPSQQAGASRPDRACNPSAPVFGGGLASLKAAIGERMGEPLECERVVDSDGNTQQGTTHGLAYYRRKARVACFTTGWDHWAVRSDRRVVFWTGDGIEPPPSASIASP